MKLQTVRGAVLLLSMILSLSVISARSASAEDPADAASTTVLNAADFGARPDDDQDDTPAVQALLVADSAAKGRVHVRFARGRYDCFARTAARAHYPVTAIHLQWDFVTPFHLNGLKQLTIDGGGRPKAAGHVSAGIGCVQAGVARPQLPVALAHPQPMRYGDL